MCKWIDGENVKSVETDYYNAFAVKTDESLWAWGVNVDSLEPTIIFEGGAKILCVRESKVAAIVRNKLIQTNGVNIVKDDGSLWVITRDAKDGVEKNLELFEQEDWRYIFPSEKAMEDVIYADGGHAVKTDGSLWEVHTGIELLPAGTVYTDGSLAADKNADLKLSEFIRQWLTDK